MTTRAGGRWRGARRSSFSCVFDSASRGADRHDARGPPQPEAAAATPPRHVPRDRPCPGPRRQRRGRRGRRARRHGHRRLSVRGPARPDRARVADVRPADDPLRPRRRGRAGSVPDRRAARRRLRRRATAGPRRDDHRGGPHVLGERRLRPRGDPVRDRGERKRRRRARGIDDHPAARPRADAPGRRGGARLRPLRPEGQGDPPVDAPQRDVSRRGRQGTGHHGVPQRDLLRAQGIRDRRRGKGLLRGRGPRQPDAGPGGAARLAPQVAEHPRSVRLRQEEQGRRPGRAR